jgi:hypothetical protein
MGVPASLTKLRKYSGDEEEEIFCFTCGCVEFYETAAGLVKMA